MAGTLGLKAIFSADDRMSPAIRRMDASLRGLTSAAGSGFGQLGKFSDGVFDKLKTGAAAGAAGLGVLAAVIGHHVVEAGADFEQSITNVGAVMGKSRGQIAELEQQALSLGVSTQFSASQVSESMEHMARKGFDAEEILGGIPGVLDAIAASGEGMAEVSDAVGSSIRGFGLQAKDAAHVADVLAYAAEKTGAGILNLGTSLSIAAPTARTLGVSIEDTAAAVGLLQKMGLDASTAGSATATMLAKISKPSKDAAQSMAAMGIKFKDAKGNMLPFTDVLGQFVKAGDKVGGNMDRMAFFAELVGLRGDKAALALADLSKSGDFDKLAAGLKNTEGYAHKVAELKLGTTANQWKLLGSTVEVLEDKLWNMNSGALKGTVERVNAWISANQDLILSDVQGYVGKLVTEVEDLSKNIGTGVTMLGGFKDGMKEAFDNSAIKGFAEVVGKVFGGAGEADPAKRAHDFGKTVGEIGFGLVGFAGIVKTAQLGVGAYGLAMKGVKAAKWIGEFAGATKGLAQSAQVAGEVGPAGIVSMGNAINGLGGSFETAADGASRVAGMRGAINDTFDSWGAKAGLAAAAIGAIALAYDQASKFGNENGGWEGFKGFIGAGDDPTKFGFEGIDAAMNAQARQRRAAQDAANPTAATPASDAYEGLGTPKGYAGAFGVGPTAPWAPGMGAPPAPGPWAGGYVTPGMAPPPAPPPMIAQAPAITPEALHAAVSQALEVTVKADAGTTAEVTKKPKGAKVNLTASGAP